MRATGEVRERERHPPTRTARLFQLRIRRRQSKLAEKEASAARAGARREHAGRTESERERAEHIAPYTWGGDPVFERVGGWQAEGVSECSRARGG